MICFCWEWFSFVEGRGSGGVGIVVVLCSVALSSCHPWGLGLCCVFCLLVFSGQTTGSWFATAVVVVPLKDGCLHPLRQQLMLMECCSVDDAVANVVAAGFLVCWGFLLQRLVGGC
ncbi:hypothetical protein Ancab_018694 [Ancistrocladus abbreviatus]